ncbi:MAG: tyrosine-protein phosphatase [Novosphingobium sp.]
MQNGKWLHMAMALGGPLSALLMVPAASAHGTHHAAAAAVPAHERFIVLEGGRNFRDVGGYRTADGREVKWGKLYRSGSLAYLTPKGISDFDQLRVTSIIDLRSTDERRRDPSNWQAASNHGYWSRDYSMGLGTMPASFGDPAKMTGEAVRAMMAGSYRSLAQQQATSYRELFARLTGSARGPVVVNCSAGKDRTGIATALVLTALGVPYETIRQDYLLSNGAYGMDSLKRDLSSPMAALAPDAAAALAGVDGSYIDATFDSLRKQYGSVENFMARELGVGPRQIALLKARLLK